ncbi:MAG: hypothetical protein VB858_06020, partial [Planctomycetaceae bacterium]
SGRKGDRIARIQRFLENEDTLRERKRLHLRLSPGHPNEMRPLPEEWRLQSGMRYSRRCYMVAAGELPDPEV